VIQNRDATRTPDSVAHDTDRVMVPVPQDLEQALQGEVNHLYGIAVTFMGTYDGDGLAEILRDVETDSDSELDGDRVSVGVSDSDVLAEGLYVPLEDAADDGVCDAEGLYVEDSDSVSDGDSDMDCVSDDEAVAVSLLDAVSEVENEAE
jgi:hypothetical protein